MGKFRQNANEFYSLYSDPTYFCLLFGFSMTKGIEKEVEEPIYCINYQLMKT